MSTVSHDGGMSVQFVWPYLTPGRFAFFLAERIKITKILRLNFNVIAKIISMKKSVVVLSSLLAYNSSQKHEPTLLYTETVKSLFSKENVFKFEFFRKVKVSLCLE